MNETIGGSFRNKQYELYIRNRIKYLFPDTKPRILDVGVGAGKYGILLQDCASIIDGVEAYAATLDINKHLPKYYNEIFLMNILDFQDFQNYDIVIFGDVLEHLTIEEAQQLLSRIYNEVAEIFILVPFNYEQEALNDNPYEIHKQPDLTHELFHSRYPGFETLGLNKQQGIYIKETKPHTISAATGHNKIAIYTIAKNEEKFVNSFMDSASEADYVVVLDTGSTDNTVELLRKRGAIVVEKEINPWRFDKARNAAYAAIPTDANICVSVDLDEVFESGWGDWLRENWQDEMGMLRYYYIQDHLLDGTPNNMFYRDKIHSNNYKQYKWKYRIHEVLTRPSNQKLYYTNNIVCHHYQDRDKSRSNYLTLLEQEYKQRPTDLRTLHLLGREYFIYEHYEESIAILEEMVRLYHKDYKNEINDAYLYIGKSYLLLDDLDAAVVAFKKGIKAAPYLRNNYLNLANIYLIQKRPYEALQQIVAALDIKERFIMWADDGDAWREKPYVLAFHCFMAMDLKDEATAMISQIEEINPYFELLPDLRKLL